MADFSSEKETENIRAYLKKMNELMRSLLTKAEKAFGPVKSLGGQEYTSTSASIKEEITMSPEEIIRRKTEKIERETENSQTPKDNSCGNGCKYRIRKEKPGYYNDGEGFVNIECLEDHTKDLKIMQSNCVINNQQIIKIYEYVQQHPDMSSPCVTKSSCSKYEGADNEFIVHFLRKGGRRSVTINLADIPSAKNVELMKSLTSVSGMKLDRGGISQE